MTNPELPDGHLEPEDPAVPGLVEADRPLPAESFRRALARHLADEDPGWGPRPVRLWPQALALICVGTLLLLIGALLSVGGI
jgi:hypothetical protein